MLIFLIASSMVNFRVLTRAMSTVAKSFAHHRVVPDVIPVAPTELLSVSAFPLSFYKFFAIALVFFFIKSDVK